jgi:hypothetical protein
VGPVYDTHGGATPTGTLPDQCQRNPQYELIRPVVVFGRSPAARAKETGKVAGTIHRKVKRLDQSRMARRRPEMAILSRGPGLMPAPALRYRFLVSWFAATRDPHGRKCLEPVSDNGVLIGGGRGRIGC